MSDQINHECGLALIRLLKPLDFYKKKYGSSTYGLNKLYLMLEKQHNRGQDGAGFASVKLDVKPGNRFMHRERSASQNPIQEIFKNSNSRITAHKDKNPKWTITNLSNPEITDIYYNNMWLTYIFKEPGDYSIQLEAEDTYNNKNVIRRNMIKVK